MRVVIIDVSRVRGRSRDAHAVKVHEEINENTSELRSRAVVTALTT